MRALAAELGLTVANDNAPGQLVLSGALEAVTEARKRLRAEGAKALRLPVAGAFHSPLMAAASEGFAAALAQTEFTTPGAPVYSCTAAAPFEDVRAGLAAALTQPVLWQATLRRMAADGAEAFLETGPGDVLTGLVRRTIEGADARSLAEEAVHA